MNEKTKLNPSKISLHILRTGLILSGTLFTYALLLPFFGNSTDYVFTAMDFVNSCAETGLKLLSMTGVLFVVSEFILKKNN